VARVHLLATGGTIASRRTDSGLSATTPAAELLAAAGPLPGLEVTGSDLTTVPSFALTGADVRGLVHEVRRHLADGAAGVVVTHGTDTMEETAYFLNLVIKSDEPVVLVGSMRPSTAVSADGPLNLYNAVGVAADPQAKGRGVLVLMNDWIHGAHSLTKTSTTAVQTFMSPVRGLVGIAAYGQNDFYSTPPWKHTTGSEFDVNGVTRLPRVDIIFACADMSPDLIDAAAANGAKGIVIAGVGNGNMNAIAVEAAANAVKKGVVVVRSSRVPIGLVGRNVELDDDKLGFVASDELNPQKSRILLTLALLKNAPSAQVQTMFRTY
jgi:L-asparaginase